MKVQGVNHPPDTCDSVDGGPSPSGTEFSGRPVIVCCLPRGRATPSAGAGKQARPSRTAARQARHAVLCRRPHGQTFMLMSHSGQLGPMTPTLSPRCSPICCHALCMVAMVSDTCGGAGRGAGCGHGTQLWEHGMARDGTAPPIAKQATQTMLGGCHKSRREQQQDEAHQQHQVHP